MHIPTLVSKHKIFFLTLFTIVVLNYSAENFKVFVLLCFIFLGAYWITTKNLFFSLASMFFLTQHYLTPGKYYSFTLIETGVLRSEPYKSNGIIDGFGLLSSDIFASILLIFFLRLLILQQPQTIYQKMRLLVKNAFNRFLLTCWTLYFSATLYSSLFLSFHPIFSVVNLFQFSKIIIFYFVFTILFSIKNSLGLTGFSMVLSGFSFGNAYLAISQFVGDVSQTVLGGKSTEFFNAVEHEMRISAPRGYYLHSNEFAFFALAWAAILIRIYQISKNRVVLVAVALNIVCILLSQSRTVWLLGFCILLLNIRINLSIIQPLLKNVRIKVYGFLGICMILALTLPRISSLQYSGEGGSLSVRLDMIQQGIELLNMNPWIGYGAHTGVRIMYEYIPWGYIQDFPFEIHNAYLQMALESGLVGALAFFLPFLLLIRSNIFSAVGQHIVGKVTFRPFLIEALLMYYIIQPHGGRLELPLLGILLAYAKNQLL